MMKKLMALIASCMFGASTLWGMNCCDMMCEPCDPCYDPCNSCLSDGTVYIYGDWLYWKVRRSGLDYLVPGGENLLIGPAKVVKIVPEYDSGFRIGGGYRNECTGLDVGIRYTRYTTDHKGEYRDLEIESSSTRSHPDSSSFVSGGVGFAESRYELDYNVVDFELGHYRELDCNSYIRPFLGVKLAYIDENIHTTYADNITIEDSTFQDVLYEDHNLNAYGLSFGFDISKNVWNECFDVGLYGHFSAAVLVGTFELKNEEFLLTDSSITDFVHLRADCDQLITNVEMGAGIQVGVYECCGKTVDLIVGYEFNTWQNYADFIHFTSDDLPSALARNLAAFGTDGVFLRVVGTF